ncbi:MAG TPA: PIN domain-containing protein [Actinomycetota bacterium]|nr:PIN domain-containing protein [Actinomycetota bacterium]
MSSFIDTSAFYAALDAGDQNHGRATDWFAEAHARSERFLTHNYVVVETAAVVRRRFGAAALPALFDGLLTPIRVLFVDAPLHRAAIAAHLASPSKPSLVDQVSFRLMRDRGITTAFTFDEDFDRAGFETVP